MVKRCVRLSVCLFTVVALLPTYAIALTPGALHAQLNTTTIEFGKPLTLTITDSASRPTLTTLDLTPLRQDFHVIAPASVEQIAQQQRWQLRLYPYRVGVVTIPELTLLTAHTRPLQVTVTPAIDAKTRTPMQFTATLSNTTVWLKQALHINAELITTAPLVVLEANHPTLENGLLIPQPVTREPIDAQHTRHRIGWVWFPQRSGTQTIKPLLISVQRDGVITHSFYLQPTPLEVQPLPHYLPATLPVGRFAVQQTSPSNSWLLTQRLYTLGVELRAIDMLPTDIPSLERQLPSTTAMTLLATATQQQQTISPSTLITTINYNLPFTLHHSGMVSPGVLHLQSFDPGSGRLHTYSLALASQLAVAPWLAISGILLLLGLTIAIGIYLMRIVRDIVQRVRGYRRVLHQLDRATTAQDLRQSLQLIAVTEGWPVNFSLSAWQYHWQTKHGEGVMTAELLAALSHALYQHQSMDTAMQVQRLRELCRWRLAGLRWLR
jgi:BatD DUF11 like domain